jgi:hypothetical protein
VHLRAIVRVSKSRHRRPCCFIANADGAAG